ncbi:hypothetical protein [Aestuariirhabdus litorea]|uniref:AraC family transcriptional regulator n=1 Tax=Aestuariirhabdus litorea TaxID=2528527 RepID=A0A3P3VPC9_9GAMM|nr:hypothetical protein [Aestuariirhabdus litorea]RRJ84274.1 hypothetical protein D0544_03975 [Aestuariirhabdus litorea]RWW97496.1 hypothetical protein DZC74_03975 [Endozoicomonadaceae bacterium GTF-13]
MQSIIDLLRTALSILLWLSLSTLASASQPLSPELEEAELQQLLQQSLKLQQETIGLLDDIYLTESSILFPQTNLLVVILSQDYGATLLLEQLELSLNGEQVAVHRYSERDMERLMRRGVQTIYTTLIPPGAYSIGARLHGTGFAGGPSITSDLQFHKGSRPLFVEIVISGSQMVLKQWD